MSRSNVQPIGTRASLLTTANSTEFAYDSIAEAFPNVDPGIKPFGNFAVVQIKHPKMTTKGGIIIPPEARSTEHYNTQVAKVIALGPLCFHTARVKIDAATGDPTEVLVPNAEGPSFKPGDFVRVPKYGGDRFDVAYTFEGVETDPSNGRQEKATVKDHVIFAIFKAKDVMGFITSDPLTIRAYLD